MTSLSNPIFTNCQTGKIRTFEQRAAVTKESRADCMIFEIVSLRINVVVQSCNLHLAALSYRRTLLHPSRKPLLEVTDAKV